MREIAQDTERPIILPLSSPATNDGCTPEDAQKWIYGKTLIVASSPSPPAVGLCTAWLTRLLDRLLQTRGSTWDSELVP